MTLQIGKIKSTMGCKALPKSWWVWVEVQLDVSKKEGGLRDGTLARPECVPTPASGNEKNQKIITFKVQSPYAIQNLSNYYYQ